MLRYLLSAALLSLGLCSAAKAEGAPRFPGIFGIPSAFPAPNGTGYAGLTLVHPRRDAARLDTTIDKLDGDLFLGYTVGHPVKNVSLNFGASITSLKGLGQDGSLNLSLARAVHVGARGLTFAGATGFNLAAWGDAADTPPGYAVYVSHLNSVTVAQRDLPVQLTLGYGDQTAAVHATQPYDTEVFAGIGIGLTPGLSLSIAGTRNEAYLGAGFGLRALPKWSFALGVYDLAARQGRRQFAFSLSRGF